jgi:mannose-6-phosphate isomerase-like protein (cupin superfamily)
LERQPEYQRDDNPVSQIVRGFYDGDVEREWRRQTSVHRHSGAEAWYVLAGAQCLETPDRIIVAKAGEGAVVPEGLPMALSGIGGDIRRSVLLVIHDSSQPWMTVTSDWAPSGRCPQ